MEPSEAIAFLRRYNHWRRGGEMDQPHPYQIGQAIDAICDHAERMEAERELADRLAGVLLSYDHDLLAGEDMQWLPEHDEALTAWKEARSDQSEIDRELDACVARSARHWRPLPGDPDEPGAANRLQTETDDQAGDTA